MTDPARQTRGTDVRRGRGDRPIGDADFELVSFSRRSTHRDWLQLRARRL